MRVAAVALVLIVGAAVVLVFANTLNSWVLGGLLGGLAALLLSIPISLALFTWLTRRHNALRRPIARSYEDEPEFADDPYDQQVVYESELSYTDEDLSADPRTQYLLEARQLPASGYLRLPVAEHNSISYDDDQEPTPGREPRNYPRQPRASSRTQTSAQTSQFPQRSARGETGYQYSTHALSQHQSEALRAARQEAQRQRSGSGSLSRQERRTQALQRARTSRQLRARRPLDEREAWTRASEDERSSWHEEDNDAPDQFSAYEYAPRPASYPRQPRTGRRPPAEPGRPWRDEDELDEPFVRRSQDNGERMSGSLYNPLVRRAPYLYEDDPLREEFAQQLENNQPTDRRSSRYHRRKQDEDWS